MPVITPGSMALSHDEKFLALYQLNQSTGENAIIVIPTTGGEPREVFKVEKPQTIAMFSALAFSPDDKHLLFGRRYSEKAEDVAVELWRVPVEGGEAMPIGLKMDLVRDIRFSPDGERILFGAGTKTGEVWAMENLPK